MDKLLLTPTQAATVLGIGRSKVYELMRAGILGSVRIDICRRVPAADLEALVERLRGLRARRRPCPTSGGTRLTRPPSTGRASSGDV